MKNNFKKWVALFLSVAMIAVSGITTNTSFRAAEGTEVQETAAGDVNGTEGSQTSEVTSGETTPTPVITERPAAPDTKNSTEENSPENTQEVNLSDDQDKTDSVVKPSDTPTPTEKTEDKKAAGENPEDRNSEDAKTEDEKDAEEEEQGPDTEQIEKDLENAEQTTYSCSIGDVTVTADLGTNPHIVPKGASFDVTPVTESTSNYNYNEYLSALNKSAGATADNPVYTSGNTLFYDLAFYYDEPQKDDTKIKTEFEPQSTVSISMKFEKSLSKELGVASDARVKFIHLKNTGNSAYQSGSSNQTPVQVEKIDSNVSADSSNAQFSLDSFSVIAISANPYLTGSADSSTDYQSVLGEALNFGVVTGNFQDGVDAETNVAALKAKCTSQTGNDLTNDVEQTFILAAIDTIFNIKGNGAYVKTTSADSDNVKSVGCKYLIVDTHETKEQLESEVNAMIDYGKTQSSSLAAKTATAKIVYDSVRQKYKLDIRGGDAGTYYVDVDNTTLNEIKESGKLEVYKNDNQTIVFNVAATENLTLQKFLVNNQAPDGLVNSKSDNNTKTIIWNFPNATGIDIEGSVVGVILAPNAEVKVNGTSAGWLISNSVTIGSGEWHNTYQDVKKLRKDAEAVLSAKKNIDGEAANKAGFTFTLSEKTADGKWNELQEYTTTAANPSVINFNRISYKNDEDGFGAGENSRDYIYKISETQGEKDSAGNQYTADSSVYYAKVTVTKTVTKAINTETTLYTATSPEYYQTCSNDGKLSGKIDGVPVFNNQSKGEKTQVSVSKNWVSEAPQGAEVVFTLFRNQSETNQSVTLDGKVDDAGETAAWTATFSNLPKYDSDGKEYSYTVKETAIRNADGYTISNEEVGNNGTITNKKQETTAISASKAWSADVPEGAEVVFTLFRNQSETNQSVTLDGKVDDAGETEAWTATFSNLPKYDSDGKEYSYTVKETDVRNADGYTISDEEVGNNGTITNKKQEITAVSASKAWGADVPEGAEVVFTLFRNQSETNQSVTLDGKVDDAGETEAWTATFSNLPKYDSDGKEYSYTVKETDVRNADGYTISDEEVGNNGTITNKKQETTAISASKAWSADVPEGAEVVFTLFRNQSETNQSVTLDGKVDDAGETEAWTATFSNLPKCDSDGKEYSYTVKETDVRNADGYTISDEEVGNNGTITNKKQETTAVSASKAWSADVPEGAEVVFTLFRNQSETNQSVTLDGKVDDAGETEAWTATFSNLPKYDSDGKEYSYTVKETDVRNADGYTISDEEVGNNGTITNKKQETTAISASKAWGADVPEGAEVVFTLFRNQSETNQSVTLDGKVDDAGETEAWTATFSNLPKYDSDGKEYSYTVKETDVRNADGYTISDEEVGNNGTITNKKQETTAISASKAWSADVPEGAEVVFTLFRNQSETNQSVTLDGKVDDAGETEAWTATFSNLPKYDSDGKEYSYTVKETDVRNADGYTISDEEVGNGGTITNTTDTGSAIIISGTKTLTNGTMTAGQFRFDLYENGKKIDTAANDADGKFTFAKIIYNPDDVSAGQTVTHTYTIKEENGGRTINGIRYSSEEKTVTVSVSKDKDGRMTVTSEGGTGSDSSFVNEKLRNLTVHKRWNDNNDEAGVRPSSITVDLQKGNTVVARAVLSESNGWSYTFTDLPYETYTVVEEEIGVDGYQAENGGIVVADTGTDAVTLVNDYNHPSVDIIANKVLTGATLTNGEFMFQLHRNSDPAGVITATAANNTAGEIIFSNIPYDPNGYTVTEVAGDDASITYDTEPVTFSAEGAVTSSAHPEFRNTYRPILLRVQKRSKEAPYDPLVGATYGLYQVVEGGNDILVESEISDENGYMYYGRIQPGVIYYFKEIAAPAGHEVDPYPGQKFQVKYTSNGQIALYDENGNPTTVGDITGQDSKNLLVQYTTEKTAVDTSSSLSYSDDSIVAVAKADNSKAFAAGTKLKVTQLSGSEAKTAAAAVEAACGKINSNIAYYDIQFIDASGNEVEPAGGDVTVTIQYKGNLDLPEGTDRTALKLVHLTKEANGETTVEAVPGTVAADQDGLLQTSFTADSFSTFGVVEPGSDNTLGQNYLVTAAGVADQVSELKVAKLDTAGKYIKGAKLQIIEKATGNVMAEWNTADGPQSFARWFDDAKTLPMNVDTYYILHEVSAPDGYQLADDILFMINKYDSSITVYKYDDNGKLVIDQEAIDKWVSDTTLQMIDVPVKHETVTLVKQKLVPNEKTIQGEDKIVHVTSIQAVRTGDTTPIALFVILLAAAAVVLLILVYRGRKKKDS